MNDSSGLGGEEREVGQHEEVLARWLLKPAVQPHLCSIPAAKRR